MFQAVPVEGQAKEQRLTDLHGQSRPGALGESLFWLVVRTACEEILRISSARPRWPLASPRGQRAGVRSLAFHFLLHQKTPPAPPCRPSPIQLCPGCQQSYLQVVLSDLWQRKDLRESWERRAFAKEGRRTARRVRIGLVCRR